MLLQDVARWVNVFGFGLTVVFNYHLGRLLISDASRHFGNYRWLMGVNILNLLVFSFLQMLLNPVISIERNVLYVFSANPISRLPKLTIRILMAIYGATYCNSLVLCAVKFVFRFDRVCRGNQLFSTTRSLLLWFLFIFSVGTFWGLCIFEIAKETPYVDQVISESLLNNYNCSLSSTTYVAAVYEKEDSISGHFDWNFWGVVMGISFLTIIVSSAVVILVCIWKLARTLKTILGDNEKEQKELFKAQRMQTFLPFILFFLPIICVLILPIFHIDGNVGFSVSSILVSFFPCLDPIAVILSISQYRMAMWGKKGEQAYSMQQLA